MESKIKVILNEENKKMIVANINNGMSVRLPLELHDLVMDILENKINDDNIELFLKDFDSNDTEYLMRIYTVLQENEFTKTSVEKTHTVSLQITNKCNLRCQHCCVSSGVELKNELKLNELKETIDKIIKFNPKSINISGGEPLIHKYFNDISEYLFNNYHGRKILSTNGTLISDANVGCITKYYDQVDISLDGVDEKTTSLIRGPGVFNKVIDTVKLLQSKNFFDVNLSMVLTEHNEKYSDDFIMLNKNLNTNYITRLFSPVGRGKENIDLFVSDNENTTFIPKDFQTDNYKECGVSSCSAGENEIFISANGDIYPCPSFYYEKYKIGNIKNIDNIKNNIDFKLSKESTLSTIRDIDNNQYFKCNSCNVYYFCWTCPGHINEFIGRKNALNYRCEIMKKVLERGVWIE